MMRWRAYAAFPCPVRGGYLRGVHLWAAAEAFRRFGSAFRSEGWKVLEELGVEGDGKLASWARRRLHLDDGWLGAPLLATAAYIASLCHEKNIYMRG